MEESIRAKNKRTPKLTTEGEDEAEEKEDETEDQPNASDTTVKRKADENIDISQATFISGDYKDAIKPVNSFRNGISPDSTANECSNDDCRLNQTEQERVQFKSVLHADDQLKHFSSGCTRNVASETITGIESAHHKLNRTNYTTSQKWDGDNVLAYERNTRSQPTTEPDRNSTVSCNSNSDDFVTEKDRDEASKTGESVCNEMCLGGVTTRNSSLSEGHSAEYHDIYEDDEDEVDSESVRLDSEKDTQEMDDDTEDENITDDDECSDSEKMRWSYLHNYRTMVNSVSEKNLGRARRFNGKVLRYHPTNFIALRNQVNLYMTLSLTLDDSFASPALEILERLKQVAEDRKEMLIAKAEVAAMHERIANSASDLLNHSIPLFEEVLQEIDLLPASDLSDSTFRDLAALWKRDLVDVYLELMKATNTLLERHGHSQSTVFSRIKDILRSVVSDEDVTKHIRAQASMELGEATISYLGNVTKDERNQQVFEDIDQCFRQASLLDPDDTEILLRAARQQRISAKAPDELKEVIEILNRCVDKLSSIKGDQKDVALHHLGLAYRSLWLKTGKHTVPLLRIYFRSTGLRDANGFCPPVGCLVIKPPNTLFEAVLVPRPYKNPPKYIAQRESNPIARDDDPNLLKARESFLEADHLTAEGSGCLYPVEVARTYISTGDTKKAQEYLERGHKRKGIGQNGVYLYEQMGQFEESALTDDWNATAYDLHLEKIKSIYREAIRYDTRGTRNAIMAFYRLLDILYGQIHSNKADLIVQTEYFLLYMTVQQTDKPNEMVKTMTDDDIKTGLMWRLIEMFHERNNPHDAAAAFTYISIIAAAKKLPADVKDVSLTISDRQRLLLESTERVALERTVQPRYLPQAYQWLCYLDDIDEENRSTYDSPFGILVDKSRSAELKAVCGTLRKQLELKSFEIIKASEFQDELSEEGLGRVLDTLRKFASIAVITKIDSSQTHSILSVVEAFCTGSSCNRRRICQAMFADVEDYELISDVPTWHIDKESAPSGENKDKEVNQACRLLRTLFGRQK